jgi:hypothetical protein
MYRNIKPWGKPLKQTLGRRKETKPQEPSTSNEDIQDSKEEEYALNAKIHLNNDVPEEVQQFIKSISKEPKTKSESSSELNFLGLRKTKVKRLPNSKSVETVQSNRRASVQVIITTDYEPNNLSNVDYDRLKQVRQTIFKNFVFQVEYFSEYCSGHQVQ